MKTVKRDKCEILCIVLSGSLQNGYIYMVMSDFQCEGLAFMNSKLGAIGRFLWVSESVILLWQTLSDYCVRQWGWEGDGRSETMGGSFHNPVADDGDWSGRWEIMRSVHTFGSCIRKSEKKFHVYWMWHLRGEGHETVKAWSLAMEDLEFPFSEMVETVGGADGAGYGRVILGTWA